MIHNPPVRRTEMTFDVSYLSPAQRVFILTGLLAVVLLSSANSAPEISVVDDQTNQVLTDNQANPVDYGCVMPGNPVTRNFTVTNTGPDPLVLPANGLALPPGYTLVGGWPSALITPEVLVEIDSEGGGVVTGEEFGVTIVNMPSIVSVQTVAITIPLDPAGTSPPLVQLPYVDSDGVSILSPNTTGLDTDPVSAGNWLCQTPGTQSNPNGDVCFEFVDRIFPNGPNNRLNRHRTFITRLTPGAFGGTLSNPLGNDVLRYGVAVEQLNPPAIPGGGDNGDGDNYGIGGIEVTITFFNSDTNTTESVTGEFVTDFLDNDHSEVTVFGSRVQVPVPIVLGTNQSHTFPIRLDADTEGVFAGDGVLQNNDDDESPFEIPFTGIVDGTPPTIDNVPIDITVPAVSGTCAAPVFWIAPAVNDALDSSATLVQSMGDPPGSSFPAGTSVIEYTATDCAGNSSTASFTVTVQDQTPPTLQGSLPKRLVVSAAPGETTAVVSFATLTAVDDCDPDPIVTCTPASGSQFPLGSTTVTCTAQDASGNMSPPASFEVIVIQAQLSPSPRALDVVALRGDPAPGISGASLFGINHAVLTASGQLAIEATMTGAGVNNIGIWVEGIAGLGLVSRKGDLAPGTSNPILSYDDVNINDNGETSFKVRLSGATANTDGAVLTDAGGALGLAVREGDTPPGTSASFSILNEPAFNAQGTTYVPANLLLGTGGVTSTSDTGIWSKPSSGSIAQLAREGDPVGSALPGAIYGQMGPRVSVNDAGEVVFYALFVASPPVTVFDNVALLAGDPSALTIISREGDVAPGTDPAVFSTYGAESINSSGAVAFEAFLKTGGGGSPVTTTNNTGIYANSNGVVQLVAREGDVAPCVAGPAGVFADFREIIIVDNGDVYFRAFLRGPTVDSATDGSLWKWKATDQTLHPIAREGDLAPGTQGSIFTTLEDFAVSPAGAVAHLARLNPNLGDSTSSNNHGLWLDPGSAGFPILRIREGDTLDLGEAQPRTIVALAMDRTTNNSGGAGGHGRVIGAAAEVALNLTLNFNGGGAFVVPAPAP